MALDYPTIIEVESERLAATLDVGPLDARVPGCPEWTLADLGQHMIGVQRWATYVVINGEVWESAPPHPADADVAEVLRSTTPELLAAIDTSDPDAACWNFSDAPHVTSFWYRRQALEIAVHRWDGDSAVGDAPESIPAEIAADIVDEFVHITIPRVVTRESIDLSGMVGDVHVHCTDTPGEWTFEAADGELVVSDEHRKSAVAIRGAASDLALFLYGRVSTEAVEIFGDTDVLSAWGDALKF